MRRHTRYVAMLVIVDGIADRSTGVEWIDSRCGRGWAVMLGQLDVVKAFVAARPGVQRTLGPHSIALTLAEADVYVTAKRA